MVLRGSGCAGMALGPQGVLAVLRNCMHAGLFAGVCAVLFIHSFQKHDGYPHQQFGGGCAAVCGEHRGGQGPLQLCIVCKGYYSQGHC